MGTGELLGKHKKIAGEWPAMDYIVASHLGGVEILLAASWYKSRDKLRQLRACGSKASLLFKPNNVNHVNAHFKVFSNCIAMKSNQGFSLIKIVSIANANAHCSHWLTLRGIEHTRR